MVGRIDYQAMAPRYDRGRDLRLEDLDDWRKAIAPFVPPRARIGDIGSGTGTFARAFVEWFPDATVLAVEPSAAIRAAAAAKGEHSRIELREGAAEHVPATEASLDVAWLSAVVHHVDRRATARALVRALAPGGHLLLRGAWPGRTDRITLFRYFPAAAEMLARTYPQLPTVIAELEEAGFRFVVDAAVPQRSADDLADLADKAATRADSSLTRITDEEFASGLARLRAAAARDVERAPVIDWLDLVVFMRP